MHFNAPQTFFPDIIHLVYDILHTCVDGAKTEETRFFRYFLENKIIDMTGVFRSQSHRQDHKPGGAGHRAPFQEHFCCAVDGGISLAFVKGPDTIRCLGGNGIGVDVGVKIDKFQNVNLISIGCVLQHTQCFVSYL